MKTIRIKFSSTIFIILFSAFMSAYSCSCIWLGPFLTVAPETDLVLSGKVLNFPLADTTKDSSSYYFKGSVMNIEVLETFSGNVTKDTLAIQGQDGMNCNLTLNQFQKNSTWIFALRARIYLEYLYSDTLHSLLGCGEHAINLKNDTVSGFIDEDVNQKQIEYDLFKNMLSQVLTGTSILEENRKRIDKITVSPNPFNSSIKITYPKTKGSTLTIYNSSGKLIKTLSKHTWDGLNNNGHKVPSGIYLIQLKANGQVYNRRVSLVR